MPQDVAKGEEPGIVNPYAPLAKHIRESTEQAVDQQLQHIAKIQSSIRGRDGKIKRGKFHASVLALRWEGFTPKETAEILGCSHAAVDSALLRMREAASMDEQLDRLDTLIVPLAIDNVARGVMNGDRQYTMKVLDGRGIFRSHKSVDQHVKKEIAILKVVTTMPAHIGPGAIPMPNVGAIVGRALIPQSNPEPTPAPVGTKLVTVD
jgi:predicted transcriptional regulator